jgi:Fur family ferric uptake transcriptional regulator
VGSRPRSGAVIVLQLNCNSNNSNMPADTESAAMPAELMRRLQAAGLRRTLTTRAVVGVFLARADQGLTHAQVFAALQARGHEVNRVTVYRLLDRLVAAGVLSRRTDGERAWRFALVGAEPARRAAGARAAPRFECHACHREFVLPAGGASAQKAAHELTRAIARLGHRGERVDITVHGRCADCAARGVGG